MSEENVHVGNVLLVAPWIDTQNILKNNFFNFEIQSSLVEKTRGIDVLYSTDDDEEIIETVAILEKEIPQAHFHEFTDRGHFTTEPGYENDTLPEVLEIIKK